MFFFSFFICLKKFRIFILFICLTSVPFFYTCATDIPDNPDEYLNKPEITSIVTEGDYIKITFTGENDEYYFDGYNVYVSETALSRVSIASYKPVEIVGYPSAEPSFPISPEDYDPIKERFIYLDHFNWYMDDTNEYIKVPFSNDTTYYIILCSHHRLLGVNEQGASDLESVIFNAK